jgi:hypothetical protein
MKATSIKSLVTRQIRLMALIQSELGSSTFELVAEALDLERKITKANASSK